MTMLSKIFRTPESGARVPARSADARSLAGFAAAVAVFLWWGLGSGAGNSQLAIDVAMFAVLACSWNIISGFTGYLSFGQVTFFGIGALTTSELIIHAEMNWQLAVLVGGVVALVVAVPVGVIMLRLRGIYFALGMFGLAYLLGLLCSKWEFTGGTTGLTVPGVLAQQEILIWAVAAVMAGVGLNLFMSRSKFGLRAMAIRDDEEVAVAMGVNTTSVKVTSFAISALLPGIMGGLVAYNRGFIDAATVFDPTVDLQVLVIVLAGGLGTTWGPLIGAVLLTFADHWFTKEFPDYQLAVFGLLVIIITVFIPGGLVSLFNRFGWLRRDIVKGRAELRARAETEQELVPAPEGSRSADEEPEFAGDVIVSCAGVAVTFGGVKAVQSVDLEVRSGQTVFIIGANGAGKTTLFNAISGVVRPSAGLVTFDGDPVTSIPRHRLAARGLGRTFQIPRLFESLTVWENILIAALGGRAGDHAVEKAEWVASVLEMDDVLLAECSTLPVGRRRMVELARALAVEPRLILLDEVMAGMSDDELEVVRRAIRAMPTFGVEAILGIEHVIKAIADIADEIVVLDQGRSLISGRPAEILRHPDVIKAYLGVAPEGSA